MLLPYSQGFVRAWAGAMVVTLALGSGSAHAAPSPEPTEAPAPEPEPAPEPAAEPAPAPAAEPAHAAQPAPASSQADAEAQYAQQMIYVSTAMLSPRRNNSLSPRRFSPTQGGQGLRGPQFYLAIGRPDLAATYKRRVGIRWGLYAGGATLFVAGLGVAIAGALREPNDRTMLIAGAATATGGLVLTASANVFDHFAPAHPIEPAVAKNLIDEHNAALRQRLGLGPIARVRVGAQLTRSSAGISVGGSF